MQDLENNIDDLFRKAVENYQVNRGKNNWDKIAPQLNAPDSPVVEKKKNNGRKYRMLALLLMLMIAGGGMLIKFNYDKGLLLANNPSQAIQSNDSYKESKNNIQKSIAEKKSNTIKHLSSDQKNKALTNDFISGEKEKSNNETSNIIQNKTQPAASVFNNSVTKNIFSINNQHAIINQETSNETEQEKLISPGRKYEDTLSASGVNKSNKITFLKKQHGVYFGVITGLSFNKVKNQKLGKPGFDVGFKVGYQITNKIAVETEISFSKKYYFTEGKYFSMEKIKASMPPEMKVMSVDGSSMLLEVPIKLKYNICNKNKSTFFSSAGLSSYLLTKEKNNYHTLMNGTNEIVTNSYKKSTGYFASAVDVSLGYEHAIGNHNNKIRIEPYVQIPLKGIGVGTLPVMSAGLHLGVTLSPH